jgi:hypothetical protein
VKKLHATLCDARWSNGTKSLRHGHGDRGRSHSDRYLLHNGEDVNTGSTTAEVEAGEIDGVEALEDKGKGQLKTVPQLVLTKTQWARGTRKELQKTRRLSGLWPRRMRERRCRFGRLSGVRPIFSLDHCEITYPMSILV